MTSEEKDVMVILPIPRDKKNLKRVKEDGYRFHWMDDEDFDYPMPGDRFDLSAYTEQCSEYVRKNKIDGIFYSHDLANLVAGVLCERHNIWGPDLEPMFLTNHKYYSRSNQPEPIWFDFIDLETSEWGEREPAFPCYIKPTCLMMTLHQYRIDSEEEMSRVLGKVREELPAMTDLYRNFFRDYVDSKKYPLADKNIIVVEKLVEDADQHCVEGWVDPKGDFHIWEVSDQIYYPGKNKSIDFYTTPSVLPEDLNKKMVEYAIEAARQHKINAGFWNVEIWRKGDWITATEVNGRAASVWYDLYYNTFEKSLSRAMVYLCCGEGEKCYRESPGTVKKDRAGAQFHVITYGEGKAEEFLDYDFIESIQETEVEVFVPKGTEIRQTRTTGFWLARFELFGEDIVDICHRADELREGMLKQPELSPRPPERRSEYR